jgi:hypothetical protein
MNLSRQTSLAAALLLVSAPFARAQALADPSGHWKGSVQIPGREIVFMVDLVRNDKGEFVGTTGLPAENINGLPLRSVTVAGTSVSFDARRDQPFKGELSADGKSISGETTLSGYVLPFSMIRTGDAEIVLPAKSEPIGKELEGAWDGTLDANGTTMRFVLKLANQPDGTSTASLVSLDEGELQVPLVVTQKGSSVALANNIIKSSFAGILNPERTELAGTFTQGPATLPMVFRRAAK